MQFNQTKKREITMLKHEDLIQALSIQKKSIFHLKTLVPEVERRYFEAIIYGLDIAYDLVKEAKKQESH